MRRHGYEIKVWDSGKEEIRALLIETARQGACISYSELCGKLQKITIAYDSSALGPLLGEISTEEHNWGHPLLSVLVVHKVGDQMPGPGFFELAESLDIKVGDKTEFWIKELKRVYKYWKK